MNSRPFSILALVLALALSSCVSNGSNLYLANRAVDKAEARFNRGEISAAEFRAVCLERERVLTAWNASNKGGTPLDTNLMLNRLVIESSLSRLPSQRQFITPTRYP